MSHGRAILFSLEYKHRPADHAEIIPPTNPDVSYLPSQHCRSLFNTSNRWPDSHGIRAIGPAMGDTQKAGNPQPSNDRQPSPRVAESPGLACIPNYPMHLVIFDLETTGLSPRYHEIIQIAAVRMRHGKIDEKERFETFVRPQNGIPGFISRFTGITDRDVCAAPGPSAALTAFSRFVGDATLVAHNGRHFDLPFVRQYCRRHQLPLREVPFIDSLALSRLLWKNERYHKMDAIMKRLDLPAEGLRRHDARGDVRILAEAVRSMWQLLGSPPDRCPVLLEVGHLPQ